MEALTNFQKSCEGRLLEELNRFRIHLDSHSILGRDEVYVSIVAIGGDFKAYIYRDEPEFRYQDSWYIFEVPDYPDEAERIGKFIAAVKSCLTGQEPTDSGTARILLKKSKLI